MVNQTRLFFTVRKLTLAGCPYLLIPLLRNSSVLEQLIRPTYNSNSYATIQWDQPT